jgi:hypothetical protein
VGKSEENGRTALANALKQSMKRGWVERLAVEPTSCPLIGRPSSEISVWSKTVSPAMNSLSCFDNHRHRSLPKTYSPSFHSGSD